MASQPDFFIDKSAAALDEEARKVKRTKDYSQEIATTIPIILSQFHTDKTKFQDAINQLLPLEKKTRLASDVDSTSKIARTILQIAVESKQWGLLCDQLTYIVKCRSQLIAVMKAAVSYALSIVQGTIPTPSFPTTTSTTTTTTSTTMSDDTSSTSTTTNTNGTPIELDNDIKIQLLTCIIQVSEGKLCVEYEHATSTVMKSNMIREGSGANAIKDAYTLITSIPAEVIGSMSYYEKCATILNQVGLAILNNDYTQGYTLLKKIRLKELDKYVELKYYYYVLLSQIHYYNQSWLEASRSYYQLFNHIKNVQLNYHKDVESIEDKKKATTTSTTTSSSTTTKPTTKDDKIDTIKPIISKEYGQTVLSTVYNSNLQLIFNPENQTESQQQLLWQQWLQRAIIAGVLAPYDYEVEQQLQLIATNEQNVAKCGVYFTLLQHFNSKQLISWPIMDIVPGSYSIEYKYNNQQLNLLTILQQDDVFTFKSASTTTTTMGDDEISATTTSTTSNEDPKWTLLRQRVIHHDIRILSQSYTQLSFSQAVTILGVPIDELEIELASLATQLNLRLDRRSKLINFIIEKDSGIAILSKWADDLTELFVLVENTEQFIQKVKTVHQNGVKG